MSFAAALSKVFGGAQARDAAIKAVTENEKQTWRTQHDIELHRFIAQQAGKPFIAEEFRQWFMGRGNKAPHHPNVWGAMWLSAVKSGYVEKTGAYRQMTSRGSHARVTAEWRVVSA